MLSLSDPADDFLPSFLYLYFLNIIYINLSLYFLCVVAVVAVVVVVVDVAGKQFCSEDESGDGSQQLGNENQPFCVDFLTLGLRYHSIRFHVSDGEKDTHTHTGRARETLINCPD